MPSSVLHSTTWPAGFEQSKLASLYTRELYRLAHQIEQKCQSVFERYPTNPERHFASADGATLDVIYSALADAYRLTELVRPGRKKQIYVQRATYLSRLLQTVDISAITDTRIRNTIEHFAEYLDESNCIHSTLKPLRMYLVTFNFVFSELQPVNDDSYPFRVYRSPLEGPPVFPLRVYETTKTLLHNFYWSIDIRAISAQAKAIKDALRSKFEEPQPEQWMSGAIALGPAGA